MNDSTTPIYLGLGTNLGQREKNLRMALSQLQQVVRLTQLSPVYETPPWGPIQDQPSYYNCCAAGYTNLEPLDLLWHLKDIEHRIGRVEGERWGPRLIDIDLIFYGDLIRKAGRLTVPHSRIPERNFVVIPMNDLAPDFVHPEEGQTMAEMAAAIDTSDISIVEGLSAGQFDADPRLTQANRLLPWGRKTYIMGIINATPDSFSGDGLLTRQEDWLERAVAKAERFVEDGVDILDIGGQSTRPRAPEIPVDEEISRLVPAIESIRKAVPDHIVISADTYRSKAATAALSAGADWLNDIWGLNYDPRMADVAAEANCPIVIMHNGRKRERVEIDNPDLGKMTVFAYDDLIGEMVTELQMQVDYALKRGVPPENIILDPGIGFGKSGPQNIEIMRELGRIKKIGYPLLLAASRKSFVGQYLGGLKPAERVEGSAATVALGIAAGADMVRVHDVHEMTRVARMSDAILRDPVRF